LIPVNLLAAVAVLVLTPSRHTNKHRTPAPLLPALLDVRQPPVEAGTVGPQGEEALGAPPELTSAIVPREMEEGSQPSHLAHVGL
jgi:hypothetical protein